MRAVSVFHFLPIRCLLLIKKSTNLFFPVLGFQQSTPFSGFVLPNKNKGFRFTTLSASSSFGKDLYAMNVNQLKAELKSRNLKVSGTKADLIQRLSAETEAAAPVVHTLEGKDDAWLLTNDVPNTLVNLPPAPAPVPATPQDPHWEISDPAPVQSKQGNKSKKREPSAFVSEDTKMSQSLPKEKKLKKQEKVSEKTSKEENAKNSKKTGREIIPQSGVLPRNLPVVKCTNHFMLVSWNIAGMRAFLKKDQDRKVIVSIMGAHQPSVLCFQETKLQTEHVAELKQEFERLFPAYDSFWICSEAKKGYSGNAVFVNKMDLPKMKDVRYGIGEPEGDIEGRSITLEFLDFFVVAVYTPNAGDGLKRLEYRINCWDKRFQAYIKKLEESKPVIVIGDLNVAHEDTDFFNPKDPKTKKLAGTTPEERASFGELLKLGFVDTFRWRNPSATGAYTYWSQRAGNRPFNRGMRLDYCLVSESLTQESSTIRILDSFIFEEETAQRNDHCPIGALIQTNAT